MFARIHAACLRLIIFVGFPSQPLQNVSSPSLLTPSTLNIAQHTTLGEATQPSHLYFTTAIYNGESLETTI